MAFGEYFNAFASTPERVRQVADLRDQNYKYLQQRAQGRALRRSVDPATGKPIEGEYGRQLITEGIDIDPALAQAQRTADMYKVGAGAVTDAQRISSMGGNARNDLLPTPQELVASDRRRVPAGESFFDRVRGRASGAFAPKPEAPEAPVAPVDNGPTEGVFNQTPNPLYDFLTKPAQETPQSKPQPTGPADINAFAAGPSMGADKTEAPAKQAEPEAQPAARPGSDRDLGTLGSTRLTASTEAKLPPIEVETERPSPEGYFSAFLRNVEPMNLGGTAGGVNSAGSAGPDEALFNWAPVNDGTNAYTQYDTALQSSLKSLGYGSASDYLKGVYSSAMQSNTPPQPNPALQMLGPEGMAKYQGEVATYQAGLAQAKGKAQQAVMEARGKLSDFAKQYGVNAVEQRKTEIGSNSVLRDPSKRGEAAALLTNAKNIEFVKQDLAVAGQDIAKLGLVAPAVIRTYATALNPGQQLSEGNLKEAGLMLYPEFGDSKEMMARLAAGVLLAFKGDNSLLQSFGKQVEAMGGAPLAARLGKMADHAAELNARTLESYVVGAPSPTPPKSAQPAATEEPKPAPVAPGIGAVISNAKSNAAKPLPPKPKPVKQKGPKIGDIKTFPNGRKARYDGNGWEAL